MVRGCGRGGAEQAAGSALRCSASSTSYQLLSLHTIKFSTVRGDYLCRRCKITKRRMLGRGQQPLMSTESGINPMGAQATAQTPLVSSVLPSSWMSSEHQTSNFTSTVKPSLPITEADPGIICNKTLSVSSQKSKSLQLFLY